MKNHKLIKLGILTSSALVLGLGQPVLQTVLPGFDGGVVKAEEDKQTIKYRVRHLWSGTDFDAIPPQEKYLSPGESVNETFRVIPGYTPDTSQNDGARVTYDMLSGVEDSDGWLHRASDGVMELNLYYINDNYATSETSTTNVEKTNQPQKIRIHYWDDRFKSEGVSVNPEIQPSKEIYLKPGQTLTEVAPDISDYTLSSIQGNEQSLSLAYDGVYSLENDVDGTPRVGFYYTKNDKNSERPIAISYMSDSIGGAQIFFNGGEKLANHALVNSSTPYTLSHPKIPGYKPSGATLYTNDEGIDIEEGAQITYEDISAVNLPGDVFNGILTYKYVEDSIPPSISAPTLTPAENSENTNHTEDKQPISKELSLSSYGLEGNMRTAISSDDTITIYPGTFYIVRQPKIEGWERGDIILKTNQGKIIKVLHDGERINYEDLYRDDLSGYAGFLSYIYKRPTAVEKTETLDEQPNEVQPEKPAENTARHLYISYIKSGGLERPDGLTSATGIIHSTVLLKPGESYTFPDVTAPGYQLLGVYQGDKQLGVGGSISYDDISYNKDSDFYASDVYYIYGRTPNAVSKEIPAGAVKYRILNYDDTMDGTIPTYTEVAPAKEGYVLPGETLVIKPSDIPGYTFTKRLPWGAEQADSITITTKSLGGSVSGIIQDSFFYTKNPEATPTPTTPVKPQVETRRIHVVYQDITKLYTFGDGKDIELSPGQSYTVVMPDIEGYKADSFDFADSYFWTHAGLKNREEHYTRGLKSLTLNYDDIAPVTEEGRVHNPILYMQYRPVNTETYKPTTPVKPIQPEIPEEKPTTPVQPAGRTILVSSYGIDGDKVTSFVNNDEAYITPESPYIVNQPEIDGWERGDIILVNPDGTEKKVTNGSLITYESLYHEGNAIYDGGLKYTYKRSTKQKPKEETSQPTTPVKPTQPEIPAEKPVTPVRPAETPVVKPTDTGKVDGKPASQVDSKEEAKPGHQAGSGLVSQSVDSKKQTEQEKKQRLAVRSDKKVAEAKAAAKKSDAKSLPNTGETQSSLGIFGFLLALLELAGWTYQGRHDRKR